MKRKCTECGKKFVIGRADFKDIKSASAKIGIPEITCESCFKNNREIDHDCSYFASVTPSDEGLSSSKGDWPF